MVKYNEEKHKHAKHVAKYCQLIIRHHFKFSKVVVIVDDDDANDVEVLDDKEEFSDYNLQSKSRNLSMHMRKEPK